MNIKTTTLCILLFQSSIKAAAGDRPYPYWMEETKWTEERIEARTELKTAWIYLTSMRNKCWYFIPDSVISDSVIEDSRVVNEGLMNVKSTSGTVNRLMTSITGTLRAVQSLFYRAYPQTMDSHIRLTSTITSLQMDLLNSPHSSSWRWCYGA